MQVGIGPSGGQALRHLQAQSGRAGPGRGKPTQRNPIHGPGAGERLGGLPPPRQAAIPSLGAPPGPHHSQVVIIRGLAQAQLLLLTHAHALQHTVEHVIISFIGGLQMRAQVLGDRGRRGIRNRPIKTKCGLLC